jgi:periplasmic divalent cation tolerance protein
MSADPGLISTYLWEGKLNSNAEILFLIKARRTSRPQILLVFGKLHSYKLPELTLTPLTGGSAEGLAGLGN